MHACTNAYLRTTHSRTVAKVVFVLGDSEVAPCTSRARCEQGRRVVVVEREPFDDFSDLQIQKNDVVTIACGLRATHESHDHGRFLFKNNE